MIRIYRTLIAEHQMNMSWFESRFGVDKRYSITLDDLLYDKKGGLFEGLRVTTTHVLGNLRTKLGNIPDGIEYSLSVQYNRLSPDSDLFKPPIIKGELIFWLEANPDNLMLLKLSGIS